MHDKCDIRLIVCNFFIKIEKNVLIPKRKLQNLCYFALHLFIIIFFPHMFSEPLDHTIIFFFVDE